ncbi:MAG: hypothetical protein Q9163_005549, partial [Psora crenata]
MSSTRRSLRQKPKQTRLSFTPVLSSSPPAPAQQRSSGLVSVTQVDSHGSNDEASNPTKKKRRVGSNISSLPEVSRSFFSPKSGVKVLVKSPAQRLPTPVASSQVDVESGAGNEVDAARTKDINSIQGHELIGSSEEEEALINPTTRRRRPVAISLSSDSEASSQPIASSPRRHQNLGASASSLQTPIKGNKTPSRPRNAKSFLLGGTTGVAPIPRSLRRKSPIPSNLTRRRKERRSVTSENSDEDLDGGEPTETLPKRTLWSAAKPKLSPQTRIRNRPPDTGRQFSDSESDGPAPNGNGRPRVSGFSTEVSPPSLSITVTDQGQNLSDSDVIATPGRHRGKAKLQNPAKAVLHGSECEISGLDEEVAYLQETEIRKSRTRGKPQAKERSKRLNKLEELKRRRAGIVEVSDDESEGGSRAGDLASETEYLLPRDSLVDLDEYEEDFVDDDGEQAIGVDLALSGVPLSMTRYGNLRLSEYFRYEVEWMIHNKLDPAFERNDELYRLAYEKVKDEVTVHAASTFKSSVWNRNFTDALTDRPEIFRIDVPTMFERKCDACNRSGHPPKHRITLTGRKYDEKTLEKKSSTDTEEEDSEASDDDERNQQHFFLGRLCCANAEIAHALHHWRYQLNQMVLQWLSLEGHTTPEKIIERENWSRKKRQKLANKVVDDMVEDGEMRDLYRKFKQNLDAARSAK